MTRIVLKSKVGADGVLQLSVPVGPAEANREVQITIEPSPQTMTQEEWRARVQSMAGTLQGDFERPPQGDYEQRDEL
jgi:hypothetical protein